MSLGFAKVSCMLLESMIPFLERAIVMLLFFNKKFPRLPIKQGGRGVFVGGFIAEACC